MGLGNFFKKMFDNDSKELSKTDNKNKNPNKDTEEKKYNNPDEYLEEIGKTKQKFSKILSGNKNNVNKIKNDSDIEKILNTKEEKYKSEIKSLINTIISKVGLKQISDRDLIKVIKTEFIGFEVSTALDGSSSLFGLGKKIQELQNELSIKFLEKNSIEDLKVKISEQLPELNEIRALGALRIIVMERLKAQNTREDKLLIENLEIKDNEDFINEINMRFLNIMIEDRKNSREEFIEYVYSILIKDDSIIKIIMSLDKIFSDYMKEKDIQKVSLNILIKNSNELEKELMNENFNKEEKNKLIIKIALYFLLKRVISNKNSDDLVRLGYTLNDQNSAIEVENNLINNVITISQLNLSNQELSDIRDNINKIIDAYSKDRDSIREKIIESYEEK